MHALALVLAAAAVVPQHPMPEDTRAPSIRYVAPPFALPGALRDTVRFGWLDVPQDHGDTTSRTLRLALAVLPALTANPEPDPIIFIPGGPGMAAVEPWSAEAARSPRIALLRARRDFIILDPRGHGLSQPRTCPELDGAAPLVDDSPAAEAIIAGKLRACRARLGSQGYDVATLNAIQAADDIEWLRRALGAARVNLFGGSYGTRIAAEAVRRHGASIRAVVFLGPVPPGLPHLGDDADVAPEVLRTLFRRCREQGECRAAYPQLAADYDSLVVRVRRAPLRVPLPRTDRVPDGVLRLDEDMLQEALGGLAVGRSFASGAPMLIHALAARGFDALIPMASQLLRSLSDDDVAFGTNLAFHCNDSPVAAETAPWLRTRCPPWVGTGFGDHDAAPLRSDVPALILAGEFDPRTPPSYARRLAAGLTRAHLVEVPWHGHDLQHPCLSRIQRDFFDSPVAAPDLACLDSLPPLRFAAGVTPSRWVSAAAMRAAEAPVQLAAAGVPALLLVVAVVGLPVHAVRRRTGVRARRRDAETAALWLAAAAALLLLAGAGLAILVGARQTPLLPAIGVPAGWGWVTALPWALLALTMLAALLALYGERGAERPPAWLRACAGAGAALVLALWASLAFA